MKTSRLRLPVEPAVSAEVSRKRIPQIVRAIVWIRLVRLLRLVAVFREIAVEIAWKNLIRDDRLQCRKTDVQLAPPMMRCPVDAACGDLRLKNPPHRLGMAVEVTPAPAELGRVESGKMEIYPKRLGYILEYTNAHSFQISWSARGHLSK